MTTPCENSNVLWFRRLDSPFLLFFSFVCLGHPSFPGGFKAGMNWPKQRCKNLLHNGSSRRRLKPMTVRPFLGNLSFLSFFFFASRMAQLLITTKTRQEKRKKWSEIGQPIFSHPHVSLSVPTHSSPCPPIQLAPDQHLGKVPFAE